jgi:hypothetical protein
MARNGSKLNWQTKKRVELAGEEVTLTTGIKRTRISLRVSLREAGKAVGRLAAFRRAGHRRNVRLDTKLAWSLCEEVVGRSRLHAGSGWRLSPATARAPALGAARSVTTNQRTDEKIGVTFIS